MKARIFTALLAVVCFIAGAAMRPVNKPSLIFRRPFEAHAGEPLPGPLLHVCVCGQKIACAFEHNVIGKVIWEWTILKEKLYSELGIEVLPEKDHKHGED